jgi:phosphonate transport system substrate-binding protein
MKLLSLIILFCLSLAAEERTVAIAPLPMVKSEVLLKEYRPLLEYLEAETGHSFKLVYYADYAALLKNIAAGKVDIAFLGPLPYVELRRKNSRIRPIVRFLNAKGDDQYTCSLFTTVNHTIGAVEDLENKSIALTQRLSTCGYLAMEHLLSRHGFSLQKNDYEFTGSHTNAIFGVVVGDFDAGGAKTSIVDAYRHLGLKVLAQTEPLPGFLWVASETLSEALYERVKHAMLRLDPLHNPEDAEITRRWRSNIRYGAVEARDSDYDVIRKMLQQLTLPESMP